MRRALRTNCAAISISICGSECKEHNTSVLEATIEKIQRLPEDMVQNVDWYVDFLLSRKPDSIAVYPEWRSLVVAYSGSGIQVHDTRLTAFMNVHAITHILTFNTSDFARFAPSGIVAVEPASV